MLPNIITTSRIFSALALLLFAPFSPPWYACYLWCGISDILDGMLARRLSATSLIGARLDSVADFFLVVIVATTCFSTLDWQLWMPLWIAAIAAIRLASLFVCKHRFGRFCFLHTWANKATGCALFILFAFVPLVSLPIAALLACTLATISSTEELALMAQMNNLDVNVRSLLQRVRSS